jgi:hypothetical protein
MADELINAFKEAYPQNTKTETQTTGTTTEINTQAAPVENTNTTEKPTETSTVITFDPADFNEKYGKKYGKEIKEEKELQDLFSAPTKTAELESKYKTLEETHTLTKKEYETLQADYESKKNDLKFVDIKKYFADENLYKTNQIKLKYPDKDVSVISDIVNTDLKTASPVDLLIKRAKLNDADIYSGMNDSQVKEVIASDFNNVDLDDPDSWDNVTKAKIAKAGKEARLEFETLQKVELPVPVDVEKEKEMAFSKEKQKVEEIKQQWTPIVDKMLSNFKELVIPDETGAELYKYAPEVNDAFKSEISKYVDFLAYTGQPINEQTITDVLENIKGRYIVKELPKIMKAHALKVSTELENKHHDAVHNDKPLSTATKPKGQGVDIFDKMAEII